jgi:uncharacterized membrane protein
MTSALTEKPAAEPLPHSGPAGSVIAGRYTPPPEDKDGKTWQRTTALIQSDPHTLYSLWRDLDKVPLWQEQMISVVETGPGTSHWVMRAGDKDTGKTIEWNSRILADEPGRRIAWASIDGDLQNAGEVIFEPAVGDRGTQVTVLQEFGIGKLAGALATVTGRNPKQAVIENLRHFKALAETGEIPRCEPQPHGDRGVIGKLKKSLYGETIETPAGTR